jgi:hypothetical protein
MRGLQAGMSFKSWGETKRGQVKVEQNWRMKNTVRQLRQ